MGAFNEEYRDYESTFELMAVDQNGEVTREEWHDFLEHSAKTKGADMTILSRPQARPNPRGRHPDSIRSERGVQRGGCTGQEGGAWVHELLIKLVTNASAIQSSWDSHQERVDEVFDLLAAETGNVTVFRKQELLDAWGELPGESDAMLFEVDQARFETVQISCSLKLILTQSSAV